uniref:Protein krueppel n=1 Tax=Stomoxys calcitrans TaxID=35570 RepID=A0A1I8NZR3_STOCA
MQRSRRFRPWSSWCRLCANEETERCVNILANHCTVVATNQETKITLKEALEKYFWVQTSVDDVMPHVLCQYCYGLVSTIIHFNERVERVQQMYNFLSDAQDVLDLKGIKLKFDVTDNDKSLWFPQNVENYACDGNQTEYLNEERNSFSPPESAHLSDGPKSHESLGEMTYDEASFVSNNQEVEKSDPFDTVPCAYQQHSDSGDSFKHTKEKPPQLGKSNSTDESLLVALDAKDVQNESQRKRKKLRNKKCSKKKVIDLDFPLNGVCKECGERLPLYSTCCQHMKLKHDTNNENKQWKCPSCDRVLQSWYNFERHMRIHMPVEERKTKKCTECESRFTSKAQLEAHVNFKHKNDKNFICEECGLSLRTNSNLRQHLLTHTDLKPFECEVCKKKFKNNSRLRIHMDTHSPNKHICPKCGLQLNSRATLNRHFLVHSDDMKHNCDYCGRAFKRAKALKNHLLLHTGLKPYSCEFCERTFANGSNCRSHMKKLHPEELAVLEASGNKMNAKNIPKLETLKAVTKAADNLTPVVTKYSGCFAFGRKPKPYVDSEKSKASKSHKMKKSKTIQAEDKPLKSSDCQFLPLVGENKFLAYTAVDAPPNRDRTEQTTSIPNFDNIYQHLIMKQNMPSEEVNIKETPSEVPHTSTSTNITLISPQHQSFYSELPEPNIIENDIKIEHPSDGLVCSGENHTDILPQ